MTDVRRGAIEWARATARARAAYDVVASVAAGETPTPANLDAATRIPPVIWDRVLALEGCAAWLAGTQHQSAVIAAALTPAAPLLDAARARALRNALAAVQQVAEIAALAAGQGIRVMVVKGAARLLTGEPPESRAMADIDLLVAGEDAMLLHDGLRDQLGYTPDEPGTPARHLPSLVRAGSLPVEVHRRLSDTGTAIDRRIWTGTRWVSFGADQIEIPDATSLLMHALDHAVVVHAAARFRLRDVLDVAVLAAADVDRAEMASYIDRHGERGAVETLVAAASGMRPSPLVPVSPAARRRAWRRIRRVGRARLLAPARADIPAALDPRVLVLSQLAQASPRGIWRLVARAATSPARAARLASGQWLPVEAERARSAAGQAISAPRKP